MASTSLSSWTLTYCLLNLEVERQEYTDFKLSVLPDLCAAVILGQDFMGQHESICVKFGGKRPPLNVCGLTTFTIPPP